jgi:AmmeMemoRadiSam system protein A
MNSNPSSKLPILSREEEQQLLRLALRSIENGLRYRRPLAVDNGQYPASLLEPWPVFVTLRIRQELRGCIGTMEPEQSLAANVSKYAYYAAFQDSRFSELTWEELTDLHLQISVLSRPQPMSFTSEADLLRQIQPGADGLVLDAGFHRGTFLPSVWEVLPEREDFWRQLKRKAGLEPDYWGSDVRVSRYITYCFSAEAKQLR